MTPRERSDFVFKKKLCANCLLPTDKNHTTRTCPSKYNCRTCNGRHNSILHWEKPKTNSHDEKAVSPKPAISSSSSSSAPTESPRPVGEAASAENTSSNALHHKSQKKERLTVLKSFKAIPRENTKSPVRVMIDDGSQSTWILGRTAKALKLPVIRRALLAVSTAFSDDHRAPRLYDVVKISLQTKEGDFYEMEAIVSPSEPLTAKMDAIPLNPSKEYPH